jgi:hypothetical protein
MIYKSTIRNHCNISRTIADLNGLPFLHTYSFWIIMDFTDDIARTICWRYHTVGAYYKDPKFKWALPRGFSNFVLDSIT